MAKNFRIVHKISNNLIAIYVCVQVAVFFCVYFNTTKEQ